MGVTTGMGLLENRTIVDRYRIDAHVDTGSSSEVYKVTHTWLYQPMILKHLRGDLDPGIEWDLRTALIEEGRLQCELHHQNLVTVHDALIIEERPALVMEFVDGPDLADWLDEREVPPLAEALALFAGVVRGMEAAHRIPVVHRDLKPENVLLAKRPDGGFEPKVADFGLAKRLKAGKARRSLSGVYTLIGTPEYMAPEQASDPGLVDVRADIYSLGALLYELATGHVAFDAEDAMQVLDRVATGDFERPDAVRPGLPPALVELILSMMESLPGNRPRTCTVVLSALERIALAG